MRVKCENSILKAFIYFIGNLGFGISSARAVPLLALSRYLYYRVDTSFLRMFWAAR